MRDLQLFGSSQIINNDYNIRLENKVWFTVSYFVETYNEFIKTVVKIAK